MINLHVKMLSEVCTPLVIRIMKNKCVRNAITKADVTRGRRKRGAGGNISMLEEKRKEKISKHASCGTAKFEPRL